jgi:glutathione S-transferase
MKLIATLTSPYARKVRVVMAEKRIECDLQVEPVGVPDSPVFRFNPLGKVPVLLLDDGTAIYDSPVIVDYLDNVTPVGKLIPEPTRSRIHVKSWEALADGIIDAAVSIVTEKRRAPAQQSEEWVVRQRKKVDHGLQALSQELGDKDYCTGATFNLADVVTGCALFYLDFRFAEIGWRGDYDNLARLAEKLGKRKSFKDTVPPAV